MQLKVENKFIDYFNENTEIYQGMSLIDRELGGTTPIDIVLTLPEEEIIIDEDDFFLARIQKLQLIGGVKKYGTPEIPKVFH